VPLPLMLSARDVKFDIFLAASARLCEDDLGCVIGVESAPALAFSGLVRSGLTPGVAFADGRLFVFSGQAN